MHGAAKVPHWNSDTLAQMLGRKRESVQLFEGHVGGGFGIRGEIYPEDVLVCAAALKFRKSDQMDRGPARASDRGQSFARAAPHRVRAAIDARGQILGIDDEFFHDNGAYMRTHAATVPDLAAAMLPGPYRVPAYRAVGHIRLTNKTPCGTYRAPGRYESSFVRERLLDAIAAKVGVDKVEIRRRNLIGKSAMPYALGLGYARHENRLRLRRLRAVCSTRRCNSAGWDTLQSTLKKRRANGEKVGAGVAMFVEKSGLGPFDTVKIEVKSDGSVEVITGVASIGQGIETVIAQICADALGVNYNDIKVIHGQTDRIDKGMGAFASRVTVMCGEATRMAAAKLREHLLLLAAELMQTNAKFLTISEGRILRSDSSSGPSILLAELARQRPLAAEATFESSHMVYPYGVHIAAVRIDADTGGVTIERYAIAYDVGRAVNPKLVEGQIAGGLAQGVGGALFEEFLYDDNGEPLSVSFADYLMPTAREIPELSILVTEDAPSPLNPLGLKGAGEGGANPVGAAIASAIDDALRPPRRGDAPAGHAAAAEGADGADLSLEIRPVAGRGLFDAAGERRADMAGHHQRAARRAIVEHLAPADVGLRRVGVFREIPVRDNRPAADGARRRR